MDRFQLEVMQDRTVVLHDNLTGQVIDTFAGSFAMLDALATKDRLESALSDRTDGEI